MLLMMKGFILIFMIDALSDMQLITETDFFFM